jgi:putative restriction endonuclease
MVGGGKRVPRETWSEAVMNAIERHVADTGSTTFSRQALIDAELGGIIAAVGSSGSTPQQTLSRELQELRDAGLLEFSGTGNYTWLRSPTQNHASPSKGVFVVGSHSMYRDEPDRFYRFPPRWLKNASRTVGQWIVYQEPRRAGKRGYYAVARIEQIVPDPSEQGMYLAMISPGSYLELGRDVAFQQNGQAVERGLLNADGGLNNGRAVQSIRPISDADFNRIIALGLVDTEELLPREDEQPSGSFVQEDRSVWEGPVDRETMLVNRSVRDRQFRKRVLDVYGSTCALTGMKFINGGGRAETQAAHLMSVEAGGPDAVNNGIALSGTIHWMFDRGLVSLSDEGNILLSRKINDLEGVERLIHSDRRARLPVSPALRPHARYLNWHRQNCFHA